MANYPQELAQDAVCQSHTGHMTGLWFLPTRPLRLNTNECNFLRHLIYSTILVLCRWCKKWKISIYRSFATRVSQLKIWHFWVSGIERNFADALLTGIVSSQFAKLAAGEQLCRCCTHRKLQHFKMFKSFSWKLTSFWIVTLLSQMSDTLLSCFTFSFDNGSGFGYYNFLSTSSYCVDTSSLQAVMCCVSIYLRHLVGTFIKLYHYIERET